MVGVRNEEKTTMFASFQLFIKRNPHTLAFVSLIISILAMSANFLRYKADTQKIALAETNLESFLSLSYVQTLDTKGHDLSLTIRVKNSGKGNISNLWLEEKAYVINGEKVANAVTIPTYYYFMFNGSHDKMYELSPGEELLIKDEPLKFKGIYQLQSQIKGKVILVWTATFNNNSGEKIVKKFYFRVADMKPDTLQQGKISRLDGDIGGDAAIKKINFYLKNGPPMFITFSRNNKKLVVVPSIDHEVWWNGPHSIVDQPSVYIKRSYDEIEGFVHPVLQSLSTDKDVEPVMMFEFNKSF